MTSIRNAFIFLILPPELSFTSNYLPCIASNQPQPHLPCMHLAPILSNAIAFVLAAVGSLPPPAAATPITPEALAAFNHYVELRESQSRHEIASGKTFLSIDARPPRDREKYVAALKRGEIIILPTQSCDHDCPNPPGALIHDWTAIVFIPGATLPQALATLQDYNRAAEFYSPQVLRSRLVSRNRDDFRVYLRLQQNRVLTVIFDTEYNVHYETIDATRAAATSYSTRVTEIENAGTPQEHPLTPAEDHGFLWRLNSYWRFYQADGGVYLQCNAISLTRGIPASLRWMVGRFIENVSRESLTFTLAATRQVLLHKFPQNADAAMPDHSRNK